MSEVPLYAPFSSSLRVESAGFTVQGLGLGCQAPLCDDRIGTSPPRTRAEVIYADSGYWAFSGSAPSFKFFSFQPPAF